MKLSLCAIFKDEALVIGRMLESAVDVVDEMILVDTGSKDKTLEVVQAFSEKHPGKVHLHQIDWPDDFSVARNFSLDHATGDWVIVLDADEFLDDQEKLKLRGHLERTSAHGIFVTQRNYTGSLEDLGQVLDVDVCRIFRSQYRYVGKIHEQIVTSIQDADGGFEKTSLHLHHIGYTHQYVKYKGKGKRNVSLLTEQAKQLGTKDREMKWFNESNILAELSGTAQWDELASRSRLLLEDIKSTPKKRWPNFVPRVYKFLLNGLRFSKRLDEAARLAREAVSACPKETDLWLMKGEIELARSDYQEAIASFQKCRQLGDMKASLVEYSEGAGTYLPARHIGAAWMRLGDPVLAREWYVTSFRENTEQVGVIPWIMLLSPEQAVHQSIEPVLRTPQRYEEFALYYAIAGHDDALGYIEKAEAAWGRRPGLDLARFAYEVRHGLKPSTTDPMLLGLYAFEQGNDAEASRLWGMGEAKGNYLKAVFERANRNITWEAREVVFDLIAAKAVRFLGEFGPLMSDTANVFPMIMYSDAITAFTSDTFLRTKEVCHEQAEWKAQLHLAKGDRRRAIAALQHALLPRTAVKSV